MLVNWVLGKVFPPRASKLGKVDVSNTLLLHAIHSGRVKVESEIIREAGVGRIFEWGDERGKAGRPTRIKGRAFWH